MTRPKHVIRILLILAVLSSNVGCDQMSKNIVREHINPHDHISLLGKYFTLMRVENQGAFLSTGNSLPAPVRLILLTLMPLVVLVGALGYIIFKTTLARQMVLGICFMVGGGIGNVYDRIVYGSVTDFMHIKLGFLQTGVFNMADVSIMIGVALILLESVRSRKTIPIQ